MRGALTRSFCSLTASTGKNEFEPASEYIRAKFIDRVQNKKKAIYPFITCATNTENFKNVFSAVKDVVISKQIHEVGI